MLRVMTLSTHQPLVAGVFGWWVPKVAGIGHGGCTLPIEIDPANGVLAGAEPLYKLDANIFQIFLSIYF